MFRGVCLQTFSSVLSFYFDNIDNNTNNNSRKILQVNQFCQNMKATFFVCQLLHLLKSDNIALIPTL